MAFPNVIYGRYGDEKVTAASAIGGLPLGQKMMLPDGREFRHARAATAAGLTVGALCVQAAAIADHGCGSADMMTTVAAAIGATTVVLSSGTTAITADWYKGGELFIRDGDGEGYVYKIKSNNAATVGVTCTVILEPSDPIVVALTATTTSGLRTSPYDRVLTRATGSAAVGVPAGVPVCAVSAGYYCWLLKKGVGGGLAGTAAAVGDMITCNTGVAGAFSIHIAGSVQIVVDGNNLGYCETLPIATEYSAYSFDIPG